MEKSRAQRIFEQNPTSQSLREASDSGMRISKQAIGRFAERFKNVGLFNTMFSTLGENMQDADTVEAEAIWKLLKGTLIYSSSLNQTQVIDNSFQTAEGITMHIQSDGVTLPTQVEQHPSALLQTNPYIQEAFTIKEILSQTSPAVIDPMKIDDPEKLGFSLKLLPGIPEGVVILYQHANDIVVHENKVQGGIHYHQFTVIDMTSGKPQKQYFTIWEIIDNRNEHGDNYIVLPEIPFHEPAEVEKIFGVDDQDEYARISGVKRRGIIPEHSQVFGHLPSAS